MHQTKKGNQWHFGMKAHIGVDSETGIVHSLSTTVANAHDVTEAHGLVHGRETVVWCDAGYQGVHKREENLGREVEWQVAMRPGKRWKLDPGSPEALAERSKASVRAKVEHPFLKVKRVFGLRQGALPGTGEEHGAFGAAFWLGQPADGGGTTDWLRWAQWAKSGRGPTARPGRARNGPAGAKWEGRTLRKMAPEAGLLSRNSPGNHQKNPRSPCSEDS